MLYATKYRCDSMDSITLQMLKIIKRWDWVNPSMIDHVELYNNVYFNDCFTTMKCRIITYNCQIKGNGLFYLFSYASGCEVIWFGVKTS